MIISKDTSLVIKGIAILCMFFHHAIPWPERIPISSELHNYVASNNNFIWCGYLGRICIPLFMFVTGVGMGSFKNFSLSGIFSRVLQVFVKFYRIYLFSLIIGIILLYSFPVDYMTFDLSLHGFVKALLLIKPSYICLEWWYASVFLALILFVFPTFSFLQRFLGTTAIALILLISCYLSFLAIYDTNQLPAWISGNYQIMLIFLPIFSLGYAIGACNLQYLDKVIEIIRKKIIIRLGLLFTVLILSYEFIISNVFSPDLLVMLNVLTCAVVFMTILLVQKDSICCKILSFLGKYSAYMWLNHSFILYYYFGDIIYSTNSFVIVITVTTILSFIIAVISDRILNALVGTLRKTYQKWKLLMIK